MTDHDNRLEMLSGDRRLELGQVAGEIGDEDPIDEALPFGADSLVFGGAHASPFVVGISIIPAPRRR